MPICRGKERSISSCQLSTNYYCCLCIFHMSHALLTVPFPWIILFHLYKDPCGRHSDSVAEWGSERLRDLSMGRNLARNWKKGDREQEVVPARFMPCVTLQVLKLTVIEAANHWVIILHWKNVPNDCTAGGVGQQWLRDQAFELECPEFVSYSTTSYLYGFGYVA